MKKGLNFIIAMATAASLGGCAQPKESLPESLKGLPQVTKEYLLAANTEDEIGQYRSAIGSVKGKQDKTLIAMYAADQLLEKAEHTTSYYWGQRYITEAIEIYPNQWGKEMIIQSAIPSVKGYASKNDLYFTTIAARFVGYCAGHVELFPERKKELLEISSGAFKRLAGKTDSHSQKACFLTLAEQLEHGKTDNPNLNPALTPSQGIADYR